MQILQLNLLLPEHLHPDYLFRHHFHLLVSMC